MTLDQSENLAAAESAFRAKRFAEAAALYRRAFASGGGSTADRLRYGLCCLFSGDRAEFERIDREHVRHTETHLSPSAATLLKRYAALGAALGTCALLSACDRATYPYERKKDKKTQDDEEVVIVTPPVMKYAGPVVSLYSVSPTAPVYPIVSKYGTAPVSEYPRSPGKGEE